ncbi:DUF4345 domain-containing protein [Acetobacteraceae bacterium KSS8]|uniref:DUF4345 domain-containing protein n=1 Tax=Endosaccharibacter trunci TaxID=2812733 RepID=A0ABT1W867_9PROT|nr:DUF4345 domain-containing protein [Acetobacteraceae bacterium KSS8]
MSSRRALQIAVAVLGLVPVGAGLAGAWLGPAMVGVAGAASTPSLDSHMRYLSGLLLGIGLAFWSLIPRIEARGGAFRLLTAIVFVGGLARLSEVFREGLPPLPMLFGLGMELLVTPLLCFWQARVARLGAGMPRA